MNKQELATKIWATANELRKNIKASEYKDYILGFMFYKYLCDKEVDYLKDLGGEIDDLQDVDVWLFIPWQPASETATFWASGRRLSRRMPTKI